MKWRVPPKNLECLVIMWGGVFGTILSLISIIYIYKTYKSQLEFSKKQNLTMKIQQFENTFFELLNNQRQIILSLRGSFIEFNSENKYINKQYSGYEYINRVSIELKAAMQNFEYDIDIINMENLDKVQSRINEDYCEIFNKNIVQLGHYFRHLYHLLKYVDEFDIENRKKYIDIIQAQMTDSELYVCFYNGVSQYGKDKMKELMDNYSFLENIKCEDETIIRHSKLFYKKTNFKFYES